MIAHALLVVIAANEHADRPASAGPVTLTCNEIRRLLPVLIIEPHRPHRTCASAWTWSDWRRRHQHRSRTSHYKRQETARQRL